MVLFLELVFTISFSLVSSFCFAWFLSIVTTDVAEHDPAKKETSRDECQEEFEGCNLKTETETAFGSDFGELGGAVDDQRPELFAVEVEKTEEKAINEAQEAETQMGLIKEEVAIMEGKEEKERDFDENQTTQFQEESDDYIYSWEAETEIGFSLDDQSPELYPGKVEETEGKSLDEAQEGKPQMGLTSEEVGIEEKEEKDHNSAENKSALVNIVGLCSESVELDDQRLGLFHGKVVKTQEKSVDEAQEAETEMGLIDEEVGIEEKEEKEHDSTENKTAFVHVKLDDQRLELYFGEVEKTEEKPVDEAQEAETEMVLIENEVGVDEKEEIGIKKSEIESDDWVGIERSELERLFGAAVAFVDSKKEEKTSSFSSDLKLQFFGLYQVAMAGPCLLPQPMALKFAARAKWDAWQQFGNMSSEEAMEHYINLLSSNFPGWMEENVREPGISNDS